jgi:hypothetical protein
MVSKNHEILTIASRHHKEGLHQFWARNSKVENTIHVRYRWVDFCNFEKQAQNSIKSPWIDLKFYRKSCHKVYRLLLKDHRPIWYESTKINGTRKIPQKWTLALDSSWSVISWGIRWLASVKTFNSRHWSKPCKRNKSKRARNDESKEKLEGKVKSPRRTHQEHTNWFKLRTPEDTRWLGPPFPQRFMVLTLIGGLVDLSHTST